MAATVTREQIDAWLDAHWDLSITLGEWWKRLADDGFSQPAWPVGIGGMKADGATVRLISETMAQRGVIAPPTGMGPHMGGPTIIEHGTPEQVAALRRIATGEELWCQLFSEPGFGSDLAGLQTRAVRDGDGFVVTGQKVWNSSANLADVGMLLARTNPDAPKHAGLTFFLIDMRQPGIEARPLRTMNGGAQFCEVFLDGARARAVDIIGELDGGWRVASTMLGHERKMAASGEARGMLTALPGPISGQLGRVVGDVVDEARSRAAQPVKPMINSARVLIRLAQACGAIANPVLRDDLVKYHIQSEVYRLTNLRTRAAAAAGKTPGPESSTAKVALSGIAQSSRDLGLRIVGAGGMIVGDDAPSCGEVQYAALSTAGVSLGGGTDEIQRNVIAERALGLPRDPK
jgi:alkylation response protein AidB-like acyl-CoA dehydrogenase